MANAYKPTIENPKEERIFNIFRYVLGSFLILSGIGMLLDPTEATNAVQYAYKNNQEFLPGDARFQMTVLAVIEILSGILFLAEKLLYGAIFGTFITIMTFAIPLGEIIVKGWDIPACGCSGMFDLNLPVGWLFARNWLIIIIIWWMTYAIQYRKVSYSKGKPQQRTPLEMLFQKMKKQNIQ